MTLSKKLTRKISIGFIKFVDIRECKEFECQCESIIASISNILKELGEEFEISAVESILNEQFKFFEQNRNGLPELRTKVDDAGYKLKISFNYLRIDDMIITNSSRVSHDWKKLKCNVTERYE